MARECCEDFSHGTKGRDLISLLSRSYNTWAELRRERPVSFNAFGTLLADHDIEKVKITAGMVPYGFQLTAKERARLSGSEDLL